MILGVYGFYDKKSHELVFPSFMKNDDLLKRDLIKMYNEKAKVSFIDFPQDFDVYQTGVFDTNCVDLGQCAQFEKPRLVCNVAEIIFSKEQLNE